MPMLERSAGQPSNRGATQSPQALRAASRPAPSTDGPEGESSGLLDQLRRERIAVKAGIFSGFVLALALSVYFIAVSASDPLGNDATVPFIVVSEPPGVDVYLDGERVGKTSETGRLTLQLDCNNTDVRWLELRHPSYLEARRALSAYSGLAGMEIRLRRKPVEFHVETRPTGAEVWIGEQLMGFSPLTTRVLVEREAPVRLQARLAGYQPAVQELALPPPGQTGQVELFLTPQPPQLQISTDPPGAMVRLNGEERGLSPLTIALDESLRGKRITVSAAVEKFDPVQQEVDVPEKPGGLLKTHLSLRPADTRIVIHTIPPGGELRVNGRRVGRSPQTVTLSPGELARPIALEGLVPGAYYGRALLPSAVQHATTHVQLPLDFFARCVVFAMDCSTARSDEFETQRAAVKEQVHLLEPHQRFAVLAVVDGRRFVGPEPEPVLATNEQKIRAYDRLDALRPESGTADPAGLLKEALVLRPDTVWIYTNSTIDRAAWLAATGDPRLKVPAVQLVSHSLQVGGEWLREWLDANNGTLTLPGSVVVSSGIELSLRE